MPNEVFLRTRAGLSTMVSSRAADRILEGALKGSGHDPEVVNGSQMRTALMGPVLEELENVLPRAGLRRNLERLAKSLREPNGEKETPTALLTGSIPAPVEPTAGEQKEASSTLETPAATGVGLGGAHAGNATGPRASDPGAVEESPSDATRTSVDSSSVSAEHPSEGPFEAFAGPPPRSTTATATTASVKKATPRLLRRLTDDELEAKVTRFALIEHVRLVAAIRANGEVPVNRGEGLDLELLSRLCRLTLSLLAKGGELRSVHLGHSHGQLFLFPIGPDLLIVLGSTDLNLGSVTTAFTALALEEEL